MSELTRRALIGGLAGGVASGVTARRALADTEWPSRTITIIHGFAAGGPSDVVARVIADGLSKSLGQPIIVEPRPGASGTTAAALIARSTPDGYTLGTIPAGHATAAATFAKLPFRAVDDFTMISLATIYPYVMAVNVESPIKSVAELIEAGRTRSTPLLYGTPGVGSGPHLAIELFALQTKIKVQHIPFKGSEPAATELVANRLDFMMDPPASLIGFIRAGKLRALAVSTNSRYFALPDISTVAEIAVPGFDAAAWQGLIAPAGLPKPILTRLNTEVVRLLKAPATIERLHSFGNEPAPSTPEEFKKRVENDIAKWSALADEIHFEKI